MVTPSTGYRDRIRERNRRLVEMYHQGATDAEIMTELEFRTMESAQRMRRKLGLRRPPSSRSKPPIPPLKLDADLMLMEWESGMKQLQARGDEEGVRDHMKRISLQYGVSYKTVRRMFCERLKLVPPGKKGELSPAWEEAERMLKNQIPYPEVARELKLDVTSMRKRFPGYGLKGAELSDYMSAKRLEAKVGL